MYGNVVGIVNIKLVYGTTLDNLGFAISIDEARSIIEELAEHGNVTSRAMLGIRATEINPYNSVSSDVSEGLLIDSVNPGSPAAESGLSRGDILIEIEGQEVANVTDIQNIIKDKDVGDEIEVTIIRYNNYGESSKMKLKFALTNAS
jgi:serine protease Do